MAPLRKHDQIARFLRADPPRVTVDGGFIGVLADLARASTPSSGRSQVGKTALRVRIAAATASVALVLVGAAYAAERFGGADRVPVRPTDTVDPASPSDPDERFEEPDEDIAPHNLDKGHENHHRSRGGRGGQVDPDGQDSGVEGNTPQFSASPGHPDKDSVAPDESDPEVNGSSGSSAPGDNADPAEDADPEPDVDPRPATDPRPDVDPADAIDADGSSGSGPAEEPGAELDSDPGDAG